MSLTRTLNFKLTPHELRTLLGEYNTHLKYLQNRLDITIINRGNDFILTGDLPQITRGEYVLGELYELAKQSDDISPEDLHLLYKQASPKNHKRITMRLTRLSAYLLVRAKSHQRGITKPSMCVVSYSLTSPLAWGQLVQVRPILLWRWR